jgi:polyferredoxin
MPNIFTPFTFRRTIQTAFTLYCMYIGYRFVLFMDWVGGNGPEAARPTSVEAFLPISALLGLKRFALTGMWDPVHPAGLVLLVGAMTMAFLFRKGFCGYICPVGLLSNLLGTAGRRIGLDRTPPRLMGRLLGLPKYLMLAFFLYSMLVAMPLPAVTRFMMSPYNITADARLLEFFHNPSPGTLAVFAVLAVLGVVVRNFWCRYLCPYGALLGLFSMFGPVAVRRDSDTCVQCEKCRRACPAGIRVDATQRVSSPECIGCMACVQACPVDGCLDMRAGYGGGNAKAGISLPCWAVGAGCVGLLLAAWLLAEATGHWNHTLPSHMLRMLYLRG